MSTKADYYPTTIKNTNYKKKQEMNKNKPKGVNKKTYGFRFKR